MSSDSFSYSGEYTCCICKNKFYGNPAMRNAAGTFCDKCYQGVKDKMAEGMKRRYAKWEGRCLYCGEEINERNPGKDRYGYNTHIHRACDDHREWMLKCSRFSDRMFKQAEKMEKRERPLREKRIKEEKEIKKGKLLAQNKNVERILSLEKELALLKEAFIKS